MAVDGLAFPAIIKHDLRSGTSERIEMGPGRHTGEAYFVPRADARAEDDGYLMSFVYDEGKKTSELVIHDARDLARPALATVHLPVRVPYGFHGAWVPDGGIGV